MGSRVRRLLGALAASAVVVLGGLTASSGTAAATGATPAATGAPYFTVVASNVTCTGFTLALLPTGSTVAGTAPTGATTDGLAAAFGTATTAGSAQPTPSALGYGPEVSTTDPATETVTWPTTGLGTTVTQATISGSIQSYTAASTTTPASTDQITPAVVVALPATCTAAAPGDPLTVSVSNQAGECSTFHVTLAPTTAGETPAPSGTASVNLTFTGGGAGQTISLSYPGSGDDQTVSWPSGATSVDNAASITPTGGTAYQQQSSSSFAKPACTASAPSVVQSDLGARPRSRDWVTGAEIGGPGLLLLSLGVLLIGRRRPRSAP